MLLCPLLLSAPKCSVDWLLQWTDCFLLPYSSQRSPSCCACGGAKSPPTQESGSLLEMAQDCGPCTATHPLAPDLAQSRIRTRREQDLSVPVRGALFGYMCPPRVSGWLYEPFGSLHICFPMCWRVQLALQGFTIWCNKWGEGGGGFVGASLARAPWVLPLSFPRFAHKREAATCGVRSHAAWASQGPSHDARGAWGPVGCLGAVPTLHCPHELLVTRCLGGVATGGCLGLIHGTSRPVWEESRDSIVLPLWLFFRLKTSKDVVSVHFFLTRVRFLSSSRAG